jgi:glycosyltransferase involved in cell wall biosynthesis
MGQTDIVVAPLQVTDFNRCKSGIKFLEYSAAKKPGVYQDIRQYQELAKDIPIKTGFLGGTERSWYESLTKLVKDEALRKEVGENAYQHVKNNFTIQGNINLYADYIKEVVSSYSKTANLEEAGFVLSGPGFQT